MKIEERLIALEVKVKWILGILVAHVGIGGAKFGIDGVQAALFWLGLK